jgi:ubiquitin thioesterase OTU1
LEKLALLKGYPPKPLQSVDPSATLESIGIITGDTLIVKEMETAKSQVIGQPHTSDKILNGGPLMRKIVPADNSCLFTSIGFVLGGEDSY